MKLISMTDFVLEHPATTDYEWQLSKHLKYANFLKQPLTLGMFVPTDEDGNVLKPQIVDFNKYQQAKERVLFDFDGGLTLLRNVDNFFIIEDKSGVFYRILKNNSKAVVEDLFKFSVEITLTETAIKQIGL